MAADSTAPRSAAAASRWPRRLAVLALTLGLGALIASQLPSGGFPTDLSRIGQGRPAVVLTQDASYISGMELMEWLDGLRDRHGADIEFLVAHLGRPDGQDFAARHGSVDGTVLLFAADGRRVGVLQHPKTADELHLALAQAFGLPR